MNKETDLKCKLSVDGKCKGNYSPLYCDGFDIPNECKSFQTTSNVQEASP